MRSSSMVSSAATSSPKGREWKVVFALLAVFLAAEAGVRVFETKLSKDVAHLRSLPDAARRLMKQDGAYTVLVVGNSLARCGVDKELLARSLAQRLNRPVRVEAFHPDASSVSEWAWGVDRYFGGKGPDLILVMTGRLHLYDQSPDPEKIGAYYLSTERLPEAIRTEPVGERKIGLVLGHLSLLMANRDRVRSLVGYNFLPGYADTWPKIATSPLLTSGAAKATSPSPGGTRMQSLRRLAWHAQQTGSRLVVVTVPIPDPYELPLEIRKELQGLGIGFLDLAKGLDLSRERFPDDYHLDREGARIFTAQLVRSIGLVPQAARGQWFLWLTADSCTGCTPFYIFHEQRPRRLHLSRKVRRPGYSLGVEIVSSKMDQEDWPAGTGRPLPSLCFVHFQRLPGVSWFPAGREKLRNTQNTRKKRNDS